MTAPRLDWRPCVSLLAGLALWELLGRSGWVSPALWPPPTRVLAALWEASLSGDLPRHLAATFSRIALGFGLGAFFGVSLGLACGHWPSLNAWVDPWLNATYPIPKIALIPFFMVALGAGEALCWALIAITVLYDLAILTRAGVSRIDPSLVDAARNLGADRWQILREVSLPALGPTLCAGAYLGLLSALRQAVIIESLLSLRGFGHMLWISGEWLRMETYYAYILVLAGLSLALVWALRWAMRAINPWAASDVLQDHGIRSL